MKVGWRELCDHFYHDFSKAGQLCRDSNKRLISQLDPRVGSATLHQCDNGVIVGCTPLIINGTHIADLFVGQLFFEPPDLEWFREHARKYGLDEKFLVDTLKDLPIIPRQHFIAMLHCISRTVQLIVDLHLTVENKLEIERSLFARGPAVAVVWRFKPGWPVSYISENSLEVLGYTPQEMTASDFLFMDLIHPDDVDQVQMEVQLFVAHKIDRFDQAYRLRRKNGSYRWFYDSTVLDWNERGELESIHGYLIDQTKQKEAEQQLVAYHQELEHRVEQRTEELLEANTRLSEEVEEQKRLQQALLSSEMALEKERAALEESNISLRVLMKQAEQEKKFFEERVSTNLLSFIEPYLDKLKRTDLDVRQVNYVNIIEEHIRNVTSPFVRKSMAMNLKLTPAEMQVANLIRQGKTSKQIADLLSVSQLTVDKQRNSIRKKIGLTNQKVNLKTFLMEKMGEMAEPL